MSKAFEYKEKEQVTLVKFPTHFNRENHDEFAELCKKWLEKPTLLFVFDFAELKTLEPTASRAIVLFHQGLKKAHCYLSSINLPTEMLNQVRSDGLETAFAPKQSLSHAMKDAGIRETKQTIDVNFINPFVKATRTTIETQANTPLTPGKPFLKNEENAKTIGMDIAGVISLTSQAFEGSIALVFPAAVFLHIYSNMVMEEAKEITQEIEDAAGELLNIIFGQAKAELNDRAGYQIQKAIPTIVRGQRLQVHHLGRNVAVVLPFETKAGMFHLEISTDFV